MPELKPCPECQKRKEDLEIILDYCLERRSGNIYCEMIGRYVKDILNEWNTRNAPEWK